MRGADHLALCLKQAGVDRIFALSGNQILPVFDACLDQGINIIHTRHEAAAVYMAEAHAQLTGGVGVALVAAGTGMANAIGPLVTARASDTAILLISGDAPCSDDGRGAFQEIDQLAITAPLTKLSLRLRDPGEVMQACARALRVAVSGPSGAGAYLFAGRHGNRRRRTLCVNYPVGFPSRICRSVHRTGRFGDPPDRRRDATDDHSWSLAEPHARA